MPKEVVQIYRKENFLKRAFGSTKPHFYKWWVVHGIYAKLIYASLDMGILEKKDFDDHWSSDQNKVRTIVEKYIPHPVDYKPDDNPMIRVYNGFKCKEQLKQNGYCWNGVEQVWEKMVQKELGEEEQFLSDLGILKQPADYVAAGSILCHHKP